MNMCGMNCAGTVVCTKCATGKYASATGGAQIFRPSYIRQKTAVSCLHVCIQIFVPLIHSFPICFLLQSLYSYVKCILNAPPPPPPAPRPALDFGPSHQDTIAVELEPKAEQIG